MNEDLKPIQIIGIKNPIMVSKDGRIFYQEKEKHQTLVKGKNHRFGYYQVSVQNKRMYVHKLVAQAFVKNPKPVSNKMVFHKDNNTLNNDHSNLFWGNQKDANAKLKRLRLEETNDLNYRGNSTISAEDAKKIGARLDNGEKAKVIAKEFNVSEMSIARIRKRYATQKAASPRYDDEVKKTVLKLLESHKPIEVARSTGIRYETILKWRRQFKSKA